MNCPPSDRFWPKVVKDGPTGCWLWTASLRNGYGRFGIKNRAIYAHRFAYELLVGPIPDGLVLDHLCRNPACVNPAHLEPVTLAENVARGEGPTAMRARKTHCIRGHEFTPENTRRDKYGHRACRECSRKASRERYYARTRSR